jgi:hypothetical protein
MRMRIAHAPDGQDMAFEISAHHGLLCCGEENPTTTHPTVRDALQLRVNTGLTVSIELAAVSAG